MKKIHDIRLTLKLHPETVLPNGKRVKDIDIEKLRKEHKTKKQ